MDIAERVTALDWEAIDSSLWRHGYAKTPVVLTPEECADLIAMWFEPPNDADIR